MVGPLKYGDSVLVGVTRDAAKLWLKLDLNQDGKVTFEEFETGMKKSLGSLCPPAGALRKIFDSMQAAQVELQAASKYSEEELESALKIRVKSALGRS